MEDAYYGEMLFVAERMFEKGGNIYVIARESHCVEGEKKFFSVQENRSEKSKNIHAFRSYSIRFF